ncbi:MAG: alpha/beta hydrolase [Actinobacteria bacterium]|nr:alpha/beta hydrolase [Actinomycetota bacterium]
MIQPEPTRLTCAGSGIVAWMFPGGAPDAPTVIALHDLTANGLWFGDLAAVLADRVRVVAPDLRGRGASRSAPGAASLHDHVTDIVTLTRRLGTDRFTILGHGTGALLALLVAAAQPTLVEAVVVLDGPPVISLDDRDDPFASAARVDPGIRRIGRTFSHRDELVATDIASGRLPRAGMSRLLRRAVEAEVVGSGFGWQARIDRYALRHDIQWFARTEPPTTVGSPIVALTARHGFRRDDPPVAAVAVAPSHVIDTTHTGLLWDDGALRIVASAIIGSVESPTIGGTPVR